MLGIGAEGQKLVMLLPERTRSLTIFPTVWISTNVTDRQTDGRTDGHRATPRQQRPRSPRLRIASLGNL